MALHLGDPVDDLTLLRPDGSEVRLQTFQGRPLLLVFLRHLA
jgi:peroxiredoxin